MSDDKKYPRVYQALGCYGISRDEDAELKVVPADAIVIERSDLPPVTDSSSLGVGIEAAPRFKGTQYGPPHYARKDFDPDAVWANGLANLALAEYLREHPPVDEAEVERLAIALREAGPRLGGTLDVEEVARRLITKGVRVAVDGAR